MQIQVNTDHNIDGSESFAGQVKTTVGDALGRFNEQVTRVEVHISDQNSEKSGTNDKRCAIEARLESRKPIAVTHQAASLDLAVHGAAVKLKHLIEGILGREGNR